MKCWSEILNAVGRARDRRAFERLFTHFAPRLKTYFRRRGADDEAAEELVQQTMLLIWEKAAQFEDFRGDPSAWIFVIARNLWIDTVRKSRTAKADVSAGALYETEIIDRNQGWLSPENTIAIQGALAQLPQDQAEAINLCFFHDMTHSEIADALRIPLGTLKSRIRRGLTRLRQVL